MKLECSEINCSEDSCLYLCDVCDDTICESHRHRADFNDDKDSPQKYIPNKNGEHDLCGYCLEEKRQS